MAQNYARPEVKNLKTADDVAKYLENGFSFLG
jgi:hypothetical protein